ncbi:MAG: RNA polymerase sigma factor [bacterium]|nr:RNA polymerase sigma factor [bacterium]
MRKSAGFLCCTAMSDEELISAANAGDPEAFQELYERHRDWVLRLATRMTGNHADALDVLQEAFLYFLGKFPGFELRGRVTTFLYPVVRSLAVDVRRKRGRFRDDTEALEALTVEDPAQAELGRALAGLPAVQREVVILRYVDELSVEETAEVLRVPEGTVKSRSSQALKALRDDPRTRAHFGS